MKSASPGGRGRISDSLHNHSPRPVLGEGFDEQHMGHAAIQDMGGVAALLDGMDAGFDFRDFFAINRTPKQFGSYLLFSKKY